MLNDAKVKSNAGKEYSICANEISKIANGLNIKIYEADISIKTFSDTSSLSTIPSTFTAIIEK
jgi:hypothetical protein